MGETKAAEGPLHFRNVSLHSLGKIQHGSLHLLQHHICFSYQPEIKGSDGQRDVINAAPGPSPVRNGLSASRESSTLTDGSESPGRSVKNVPENGGDGSIGVGAPTANTAASHGQSSASERALERPKPRTRDIWIPYPMISWCLLRPTHQSSFASRAQPLQAYSSSLKESDDLFPPTFGTASYTRPSTDSARLGAYSSPPRSSSPLTPGPDTAVPTDSARQPILRIRRKDFTMIALHFHSSSIDYSADEAAREVFYVLRSRCCVSKVDSLHAFHFRPPKEETGCGTFEFDSRREFHRMGIDEKGKAADGPGSAWRISDINSDYSYSATYPRILCVPRIVSDNMLKYGGSFRSRARIPSLSYLHPNGGSITRSSQPMVGLQNKRNPQDERLVSAIFSSHAPAVASPEEPLPGLLTSSSTATLHHSTSDASTSDNIETTLPTSQSDTALNENTESKNTPHRKKIYGSMRRNLIVDARPKINAQVNRAQGGGIEDIANYTTSDGSSVEKVFLNIPNIHVMRKSLEQIIESFANSDYIDVKPNQDILRQSSWLGHIANILVGSELVARAIGLGGSHVLIHCSDGWDRTAQVAALAQVMLDPHYRTLDGFISLVQKDFLSFGHKFRDRNGIEGSEKWFEIENERVLPSRTRDSTGTDPGSFNALGAKALTGAKSWFEKNRSNLFGQSSSKFSNGETSTDPISSRSSTPPPPNPLLHSSPKSTSKDDPADHKMKTSEISPVFHQFLDAIYQLQHQTPSSFEFNERFLRRLFYHVYACQYGEFLYNTERERSQSAARTPSVWAHFLCRRQEFTNPDFAPQVDDPLLFPRRQGGVDGAVVVRWWAPLFGRKDEDMNLPPRTWTVPAQAKESLGRASDGVGPPMASSAALDEKGRDLIVEGRETGGVREAKSTPNLSVDAVAEGSDAGGTALSSSSSSTAQQRTVRHAVTTAVAEAAVKFETEEKDDRGAVEKDDLSLGTIKTPAAAKTETAAALMSFDHDEEKGDPLGVTTTAAARKASKPVVNGLDFAAFASQNAFQER